MTKEEKARRYDEAIKVIKDNLDALNEITETGAEVVNIQSIKNCFYKAFPELKEFENERIRNWLIEYFHQYKDDGMEKYANGLKVESILAWLEKQGEQKPVIEMITPEESLGIDSKTYNEIVNDCIFGEDKPKFKVGDWITNGHFTYKVLGVTDKSYELHLYNDDYCHFETDAQSVDKHYHLWTIKDTKDGDVLVNGKMIVIFKHFEEQSYRHHIVAYIGLDTNGDIQITNDTWNLGIDKSKLATKEQRNLLFSKMKEAGYEWDAENKQLLSLKIDSNATQKLIKENKRIYTKY